MLFLDVFDLLARHFIVVSKLCAVTNFVVSWQTELNIPFLTDVKRLVAICLGLSIPCITYSQFGFQVSPLYAKCPK